MKGKKKYLALVIFLFVGMLTYTFANQKEELKTTNNTTSNFIDHSKTELRKTEADLAVEKAEEEPTQETIENALAVIETTENNQNIRQNLNQRVQIAETAIDVAELVTNVENMITNAVTKEDIEKIKDYYTENNIEQEVNNMNNSNVKDNIQKRINYIQEVFNDNKTPEITGIEDGTITNENVKIVIIDDVQYSVEVTLNNETIDFAEEFNKEGIYVVNVVDAATNKNSLTFTIDKTKPKFENLFSRDSHLKDGYIVDVTDATKTTITLQKDHGKFEEISEGHSITEEGTYQLVAVDEANNKYTTWFAIDRTMPTISGITKEDIINTCDTVYVADRYLIEVIIDGKKYTRTNFEHNKYNENFKFEKEICSEGIHTITAKDKIGNIYEEKFTIDKTAPVIELASKEGKNKNEMRIESGTKITVEDVLAKVTDNYDEEYTIEPYKADLLIGTKEENIYNYDFSNGFDTNYSGRYNIYFKAKDRAGNESKATLLLFMKDTQSAEIILPSQEGNNKNEYRILKDSYIEKSYLSATFKDIVDGEGEVLPTKFYAYYPKSTGIPSRVYELEEGKYFDTSMVGVNYEVQYEYTDKAGNKTKKSMLLIVDAPYNPTIENNIIDVKYDLTLNDKPFYNDKERTEPLTINGNNKTITQEIDTAYKYTWDITGTRSLQSNMFTSANGSKVTVNDLTFKGTMYSMTLGHYRSKNPGGFNTELNNVNVIDTEVASFSSNISPAVTVYGTAVLNNTNIYGTKLSPLDTSPMWPVYDLAVVNNTTTTINGGKIGTIFTWAKAYLEINNAEIDTITSQIEYRSDFQKANLVIGENTKVNKVIVKENEAVVTIKSTAEVGTLDLCAYGPAEMKLNIEQGAKIDKVVLKDGDSCKEMSYDEWYKSTTPITVNSVDEFKTALSEGYTNVIIATTLNVEENETFKAEKATVVTTKGTITMFNVKEGKTLTLENLILDGENKYKVNVAKAADMHNDPFNIFGEITSEQTKVYENKPLIITAGTLTLGNGTVIRNYAHQPVNGTAKQQYAGPAVLVTGGSVTINGLEFTNNVSQLLTAKNANITINNINVHDTWANGNKAGLIEINTGATMDVNNGTFKNNMMSMRSYGLFIANAGTINMKGGHYENNNSTRNGSNTAGSLFGVETTGKIYMTGGTVINNIGYRAGAFATRWATEGSIIELNGGTIKNNTTRKADFKNAGLFVQSDVKIGLNMTVEDKVVLRGADAELNNNGTIAGDVELVDNLGTFNNNGSVTGNIIIPQP